MAVNLLRLGSKSWPKPSAFTKFIATQPGTHQSEQLDLPSRKSKKLTAEEAVQVVKTGDDIYVHSFVATPTILLNALCNHAKANKLKNIKLHHIAIEGEARWTKPEFDGVIRSNSLFVSNNVRQAVNQGLGDFVPIFLSETHWLFRRKVINLDVAFIQLSRPDKRGYCSLGTSVDCTRAAVQNANYIIAVVNKNMPRTHGDTLVHVSQVDAIVEHDFELPELKVRPPTATETKIGKLIAENLVEDGATLQMGIGSLPHAAMHELGNHKDLGIHTEMFSDGILPLIEKGVVTNSKKIVRQGKIVATFMNGTKRLFDFVDDYPLLEMGDVAWVNDTTVIRQNPKVTAINSCFEVDVSGQIVSDSIGTKIYSGVGGQVDFLRGASLGFDNKGKPIIAVTSTTDKGESKIVPYIKKGAGVVTSRAHVHYVVTEYGIAHLYGKNLRQRAYELIKVAHPDHRQTLEKGAYERLKCMPSPD